MRKRIDEISYQSILDLKETQLAIKYIKDTFEELLARNLNLIRVSAPLFVDPKSGLNDNLNGVERAVAFDIPCIEKDAEIVHSLAKWKRMALSKYGIENDEGLYTDMNAIRRDEEVDQFHSVYVDQWDWEISISQSQRNRDYLFGVVKKIYSSLLETENLVGKEFPKLKRVLPEDIYFISTSELENKYPKLSPKEREDEIAKMYRAVFIYNIGWPLENGLPHDGRAADYDDWNLNGDLVVWYDLYECALELSSMGIRVDKDALFGQLKERGEEEKLDNPYSKSIIEGTIPFSIGGGIGQSRLCMFLLKKAHIGEVQVSMWDEDYIEKLKRNNIFLL